MVQITNYTSLNCADHPQVNIHCIDNIFTVHDFWATCACPEKTELPWNFHCIEYIFYHSGFLSNLRLPWKTVCPEFTVLNIVFIIQEFWATCAWTEKQSCPQNFSLYWIYFLPFRIFEQLALALKNYIQYSFELLNIVFIEYSFYHSGVLSNLRLDWKTELPSKFSLCWIYIFYHSRFLSNLRLPWKQSLPSNFSSPGGLPPRSPPSRLVHLCFLLIMTKPAL